MFSHFGPSSEGAWSGWAGSIVGTLVGGVLAVLVFLYQSRQQNDDEREKRLQELRAEYRQNVQRQARQVANELTRAMWAVDDRQFTNLRDAIWAPGLAEQAIGALDRRLSESVSRYYDAVNDFRLLLPAGERADQETQVFIRWFVDYEADTSTWVDAVESNSSGSISELIALIQQSTYSQKVQAHPYGNAKA